MKIWHVRVFEDVIVRADSEDKAWRTAVQEVQDYNHEAHPVVAFVEPVVKVTQLPKPWDGSCRPFGERDAHDRTIAEQLKGGGE